MSARGLMTVLAPPEGPRKNKGNLAGREPEKRAKQMPHFGNGQRRQRRGGWLSTDDAQDGVSEQDERDVTVPTDEATYLILVQTKILTGLEMFFDTPAHADDLNWA